MLGNLWSFSTSSPVLEPNLDLALGEAERVGDLHPPSAVSGSGCSEIPSPAPRPAGECGGPSAWAPPPA